MIDIDAIRRAEATLSGVVRRTALERSDRLSRATGRNVYLKVESRQRTGSFKIRGAYNMIAQLPPDRKRAGVVAASAGNHAQGVAYAAAKAGIPARIVMPEGTPVVKVSATQSHGAEVVLEGDDFDAAFACALDACGEDRTFVHPFDDPSVIAGQGTIGLEIMDELPGADTVIVPVGGGGLVSGIALAMHDANANCKVIAVEAAGAATMGPSVEQGRRIELPSVATIADGIAVRVPGELTFGVCREHVHRFVTVTDAQIARAMLALMEQHKLVVEGAGAAPLAALDILPSEGLGEHVVLIISGGSVDVNMMARIIERGLVEAGRSVRIAVTLPDVPNALAGLAGVLGSRRANIMEITHDRLHSDIDIGEAQVDLLLSARGPEHVEDILAGLREGGYNPDVIS